MRIALSGARGQLGSFFDAYFKKTDDQIDAFSRNDWDISSKEQSEEILATGNYNVLINCAAYTDVERAESNQEACMNINASAVKHLSDQCKKNGILLVHFSTDYIFDGESGAPYVESDKPNPLNVYGASKLEGERIIQTSGCRHLIGRVSWLFGGQEVGFTSKLEHWRAQTNLLRVSSDEVSTPTFAGHVPALISSAIQRNLEGTFHINNTGSCSRYEWAAFYADLNNWRKTIIEPAVLSSFKMKAHRPHFSAMCNKQFQNLCATSIPHWKEAVMESCKN